MNPAFQNELFWQAYEWLHYDGMKPSDFDQWKALLAQDFTLVKGDIDHFVIPLPCGAEHELIIHFDLDDEGCEKNLYLSRNNSEEQHLMGWWDLQRWHPYCLHPNELQALMAYWEKQGGFWNTNLPAAFMLLQGFVGLENETQQATLVQQKRKALKELGFRKIGQVGIAYHEDFYWSKTQIGWEYTSDEYSCYSMRNADHLDDEHHTDDKQENHFPFKQWASIMQEIDAGM